MKSPFYGKYQGVVTDNKDPLFLGRVRAKVNDVLGDSESGWAKPCVPFAGQGMGFHVIPPVGSLVWIEFEKGDPDYPIWTGGMWGVATEVPLDLLYKKLVIKTEGGTSITLDDTPQIGGITLETSEGHKLKLSSSGLELTDAGSIAGITISTALGQKIALTPTGIEINDGQGGVIKLQGPQVDINSGALTVI
jgi:uncharacterized protein involved in type VI secretion and phage assembly